MSLRLTARAFPTLLRVGLAEAVAYRAEMLVWVLATTMPLVMLALWTAVSEDAPIGHYGPAQFSAYFLATFIVRQLTGSWVSWEINFEVRSGAMSMRLLRPVHPLGAYAAEGLASIPFRLLVSLPVAVVALGTLGARWVTHDPVLWALWGMSLLGAWLITLFVNFVIGCAAFFMENSSKLMDAWGVFFFVLSGYLIPVEIFPPFLRATVEWLPFRYQIGLPVELMVGAHDRRAGALMVARQWAWVAVALFATAESWRRGVRRFAAYGG
jgi:ABC-2 type transport system permease protein